MTETLETWRQAIMEMAAANPIWVDVALAAGACLFALWLLIGLIRVVAPKKKKQASAPTIERPELAAAPAPEAKVEATSTPAKASPAQETETRAKTVQIDAPETAPFEARAPAPEPAPTPEPAPPPAPPSQPSASDLEDFSPAIEIKPPPPAEPATPSTPTETRASSARSPQEIEDGYRDALRVWPIKDPEAIEERYRKTLRYTRWVPFEFPEAEPTVEADPAASSPEAAPAVPMISSPAPEETSASEALDDAPGSEAPQDDDLKPGTVYGDWPYATAPQTDPRWEFPTKRADLPETGSPEPESPEPEDLTPRESTTAAPPPAASEEAPDASPYASAPMVDYSGIAGMAPPEEAYEEPASEAEPIVAEPEPVVDPAPAADADSDDEELLFKEDAPAETPGALQDIFRDLRDGAGPGDVFRSPESDVEISETIQEEEEDAAFEDALDDMKRAMSVEVEEDADQSDPNVTRMENPFARLSEKQKNESAPDLVDVSVFTPQRVRPAEAFILQAIFHVEEQKPQVASVAAAIDPGAQERMTKTLRQAVADGQIISAALDIPGATIDQPVQAFVWRGDIEPLQYIVTIPPLDESVSVLAKLQVAVDGVPVASAVWRIALSSDADVANETGAYVPLARYRRAFVSYSSKDRLEVLKRVQGLQAAGLEVFQDVLDLEPGERWAKALYKHIDDADAFYLFWSENSAASEWVAKEWRYALERAATHPENRPDICPVILTAPPPMPPAELADRHFNDILAYVVQAHEQAARA